MNIPKIDGIEIEEKIGEGGMATVWKGRQLTLDRPVAVKVLHAHWGRDPGDVERFQTEARSAAKLKHPCIIQVHDAHFVEGQYYIVMEFIDGYTVGDWLRRKGKLTQEDVLSVAECVADGLSYAWENEGIIHCDIKPDNVMVDRDGTVKVADLGLARTIDVLRSDEDADEDIMGTPAYMSPEQSVGASDLDCRADIYSLGCMLYHMLTGEVPFDGEDVDTTLDLQASGYLPDVLDVVGNVTKPFCGLLQKMMAKDRDLRQSDWQEVLRDIRQVRHYVMPPRIPPSGSSTMSCSEKRVGSDVPEAPRHASLFRNVFMRSAILLLVVVILGMTVWVWVKKDSFRPDSVPTVVEEPENADPVVDTSVPVAVPADEAMQLFAAAKVWQENHPRDFDGAILNFKNIMETYPNTQYAMHARREIERLSLLRQREVEDVIATLRIESDAHEKRGDFASAMAVFSHYDGLYAHESQEFRQREVERLRYRQHEYEAAQHEAAEHHRQRVDRAWHELCDLLLGGDVTAGLRHIHSVLDSDIDDDGLRASLVALQAVLSETAQLDRKVLDSFLAQRGRELDVALTAGNKHLTIMNVDMSGAVVQAEEPLWVRGRRVARSANFTTDDLSAEEYFQRCQGANQLAVALQFVLSRWEHVDEAELKGKFAGFPEPFTNQMLAMLEERRAAKKSSAARDYLLGGIRWAGASINEAGTYADWATAVVDARNEGRLHPDAARLALEFEKQYGDTDVSVEVASVLDALRGTQEEAPQPAEDEVRDPDRLRRRPGERRRPNFAVNEDNHFAVNQPILRALMGENPNLFHNEITIMRDADSGKAVRIEIVSGMLANLAPLHVVEGLQELVSAGEDPRRVWLDHPIAPLKDLSPLQGFRLQVLCVNNTSVQDLSPLLDMPLREFNAAYTKVMDISPLRNAPLEVVVLRGTGVRDISALRGKPLVKVDLGGTAVFDFRPLAGAPLEQLDAAGSQLRDISFISGAPVRHLDISGTRVYDFSLLQSLPLEYVDLDGTQIADLSVLRGKALRYLSLGDTLVRDIALLSDMPLSSLDLRNTPITDFSVLAQLQLKDLDLSKTRITDLTPLQGLPLRSLNLAGTRVQDVAPLARLTTLVNLDLRGVSIDNYAPLARLPLERISIDKPDSPHVQRLIASLPSLRYVNGVALER